MLLFNRKYKLVTLVLAFAFGCPFAETKVEHKPVSIAALQEVGRLQSGVIGGEALTILKDEWVDHFGAFISKEIVINERLHIYGGLGGIFQFRKPELVTLTVDGQQKKAFFIGPTRTEAEFHFGNVKNPFLKLGLGMFGYKYNPDAYNLGEYMFRTGIYPNYIMTGGYAIVNSAAGYLQGIKANFNFGDLKLDLFFTTETAMPPLYDFSFSALGAYNIMDGFINIGAGVQFKGLFSVDGERTQRELDNNGYVNIGGTNYSKNTSLYFNKSSFYLAKSAEYITSNPAMSQLFADSANLYDSIAQMVQNDNSPVTYFTSAGTKLMGRISIDPKKLMKTEIFSPGDLKLYAEGILLGLKDYPIFYTKKSERLPIMFGFNLPTFKILDLLAIQFEYYDSPYLNNTFPIGNDGANTPFVPSSSDEVISKDTYSDVTQSDNFKWSILLKRKLLSHVDFSLQVARDHIRMTSATLFYGPQFAPNEFTLREKDWYWMAQISWGI